jgi:ERCC4-type nuclease
MSPATKAAVKIIVDIHERSSGITETLVERKRVFDLHGAIIKGRFWAQLGKLRAACSFPCLLVEGSDIDRGPVHANAIRGACLAVIDQGVAFLRSGYQRDSALWLHRLAVRCQQTELAAERPIYAQRPRAQSGQEAAEAMLASVPGISTTCARALLGHFGSVAAIVAADPVEWLAVAGTGAERARALEETLRVEPPDRTKTGHITIAP